jgi:SOUL heme-binding protein
MGIVFGRVNVEQAKYVTLASTAQYEVRRYAPQLAATFKGTPEIGAAFRALASYCGIMSAPNQVEDAQKTAISMTAPVLMEMPENQNAANDGVKMMTFFLPAKFTSVESAPKPLDPCIQVIQLPERTMAVITFSGNTNAKIINDKTTELTGHLLRDGITLTHGKPLVAGYNPPFTIPALKTNEIHLPVDAASVPTRS